MGFLCFSMNYLCVYSPCALHTDTTFFSALSCVSSFHRNYCDSCTFLFRISLLIYAKLFALFNTSQSFFIFSSHIGALFPPWILAYCFLKAVYCTQMSYFGRNMFLLFFCAAPAMCPYRLQTQEIFWIVVSYAFLRLGRSDVHSHSEVCYIQMEIF